MVASVPAWKERSLRQSTRASQLWPKESGTWRARARVERRSALVRIEASSVTVAEDGGDVTNWKWGEMGTDG